jgi:PBP1b-binding outer membrane lipoprotein LpoB
MSRLFAASACALFLVACSKPEPTAPNNPTPGSAATVSQVKLELGEAV